MPDEDQITGSVQEAPSSTEPSSTPTEAQPSSPDSEGSPTELPHDETPLNTVGAALEAFNKERQSAQTAFPSKVPQGTPAPQKPVARDYTGLEPTEQAWFKKMGDQAFNELKPKYLEYKKLKEEVETLRKTSEESTKHSFFEHEQAYQLTPEYQELTGNLNQINAETSHWQKQLANIRAGQPWQPLVLDEKGNVVIGEPQDPSPQGEGIILNALMQAHSIRSDLSNKITNVQGSFSNQHKSFMSSMQKIEKDIFQGADESALKAAMDTKLPMFPKYMHGNPLVRSLAKSLAVIDGLITMLNESKSAATTSNMKSKIASNAGPKGGDTQSVGAKPGETVGSVLDEFRKARATGIA